MNSKHVLLHRSTRNDDMNDEKSKSALTQYTIQTLVVTINIQKYNCLSFFLFSFLFLFLFFLQPWQFPKILIITIHYKYGENRKLGKIRKFSRISMYKDFFFNALGRLSNTHTDQGGGGGVNGDQPYTSALASSNWDTTCTYIAFVVYCFWKFNKNMRGNATLAHGLE